MKSIIGIIIAIAAPFAIAAQPKPAKKPVVKKVAPAAPKAKYKNGIQLKTKGFNVAEAYLYFDNQSSVPQDNIVEINQRVNMRLVIDKGWSEVDGKVYLGATEVIKLNTGEVVLESEDLFAAYDEEGVDPVDARNVTLKAVISSMANTKNT